MPQVAASELPFDGVVALSEHLTFAKLTVRRVSPPYGLTLFFYAESNLLGNHPIFNSSYK